MFRKFHEPVSGFTHLGAAIVAAIGIAVLLFFVREDLAKFTSLSIYGISLILMFTASAVYHLVKAGPRLGLFLRKLDHSAIYLVIAGTYTPICLVYLTGFWRIGMLVIIWSLALTGIGVKLFVIHAPRWVTVGVYLLMGWLCLAAIGEILASVPVGAIVWLVVGGLFFTVGAIIYVLKKPDFFPGRFGFHEVWHIFVILGAFSHFVIMAAFVV